MVETARTGCVCRVCKHFNKLRYNWRPWSNNMLFRAVSCLRQLTVAGCVTCSQHRGHKEACALSTCGGTDLSFDGEADCLLHVRPRVQFRMARSLRRPAGRFDCITSPGPRCAIAPLASSPDCTDRSIAIVASAKSNSLAVQLLPSHR